jgi:hypothetical protein
MSTDADAFDVFKTFPETGIERSDALSRSLDPLGCVRTVPHIADEQSVILIEFVQLSESPGEGAFEDFPEQLSFYCKRARRSSK